MNMENKYIGIKKKTETSAGNEGIIFERQVNGWYKDTKSNFKVPEVHIKHDLNLGYLKIYDDGK